MEYLVKNQTVLATLGICKIDCPKAQCVGNCPKDSICGLNLF